MCFCLLRCLGPWKNPTPTETLEKLLEVILQAGDYCLLSKLLKEFSWHCHKSDMFIIVFLSVLRNFELHL